MYSLCLKSSPFLQCYTFTPLRVGHSISNNNLSLLQTLICNTYATSSNKKSNKYKSSNTSKNNKPNQIKQNNNKPNQIKSNNNKPNQIKSNNNKQNKQKNLPTQSKPNNNKQNNNKQKNLPTQSKPNKQNAIATIEHMQEMNLEEARTILQPTQEELREFREAAKSKKRPETENKQPSLEEQIQQLEQEEEEAQRERDSTETPRRSMKLSSLPYMEADITPRHKLKLMPVGPDEVVSLLKDERAFDLVVIDMTEKCTWCQWFVIASGRSNQHIRSAADKIVRVFRERIRKSGHQPRVEGRASNDGWMIVDTGTVIVHIFTPDSRFEYDLESHWLATFDDPELMSPEDQEFWKEEMKEQKRSAKKH